MAEFTKELLRERGGKDGTLNLIGKAKGIYDLLVHAGHWDGVLRDCVRNAARTRDYTRGHLAKLLAGNCLRVYGPRLQAALRAPAAAQAQ